MKPDSISSIGSNLLLFKKLSIKNSKKAFGSNSNNAAKLKLLLLVVSHNLNGLNFLNKLVSCSRSIPKHLFAYITCKSKKCKM